LKLHFESADKRSLPTGLARDQESGLNFKPQLDQLLDLIYSLADSQKHLMTFEQLNRS
jgi:hypothetical protein